MGHSLLPCLVACIWDLCWPWVSLVELVQVLNKVDLLTTQQQADLKQHFLENSQAEEVFLASAASGGGVAAVREWAASKLPEGPSLYSKVPSGHPLTPSPPPPPPRVLPIPIPDPSCITST